MFRDDVVVGAEVPSKSRVVAGIPAKEFTWDMVKRSLVSVTRASAVARRPHPGSVHADSSPTASIGLSEALHTFTAVLAKELGEYGISVNCIAPFHATVEQLDCQFGKSIRQGRTVPHGI